MKQARSRGPLCPGCLCSEWRTSFMSSKKHSYQSPSTEGDIVAFTPNAASSDAINTKSTLQYVSVEPRLRGWARFMTLWAVSGANYFAYGTMGLALILFATHL